MLGEFIGLFKYPVTTLTKKAEERNIKKEAIIAAIIAVVIAVVTVLTSYIGIVKKVNKKYKSLDDYNDSLYSWEEEITKSEFKEIKKEYKSDLLEDAGLVGSFFKTLAIAVVAIALVAGILFIISRMVKSPKDYIELFAMTNGAFMIYILGYILNVIFMYIYSPIGIILLMSALIFAIIALSTAFRESIEVEDTNKLVIFSSIVLAVVFAILVIIVMSYINSLTSSLSSLSSLSSMLDF